MFSQFVIAVMAMASQRFPLMRRADIKGSRSNVTMNAVIHTRNTHTHTHTHTHTSDTQTRHTPTPHHTTPTSTTTHNTRDTEQNKTQTDTGTGTERRTNTNRHRDRKTDPQTDGQTEERQIQKRATTLKSLWAQFQDNPSEKNAQVAREWTGSNSGSQPKTKKHVKG